MAVNSDTHWDLDVDNIMTRCEECGDSQIIDPAVQTVLILPGGISLLKICSAGQWNFVIVSLRVQTIGGWRTCAQNSPIW